MSPIEAASLSTHPLRVPNLETRFEVSGYTVREWAKTGRLSGARKLGREWRFPLDVEYVEEAKPPAVAEQVQAALAGLRDYEVGKPRVG